MKTLSAIKKELAIAGVPSRVANSAEARALPSILSIDEHILACVQGLYSEGFGLIVATNSRLLVINRSFFWTKMEDEAYSMINSILYKKGVFLGKLHLSSRANQYIFHVLKSDPIEPFISLIDAKMREHSDQNYA